ncbi:nitronate monooxygenase [candidate division KSB1 bacterium]|nr:nitronate monooxygenase [candidate division KSB1 bacterium]MBL7095612.1 nitronate monooxygenase [candidate division KSB1 bacterium]
MNIPKLQIGNIMSEVPIVQGGMGVRVSLSSLAAAVANEGGIGTISSIALGDINVSKNEYEKNSREALIREIRKAKSMTKGILAVNVMEALSNAKDLIKAAVKEGIKMIVVGAGLPLKLPAIVEDDSVNLVPIVSSGRAAGLILRSWDKRYQRTADGFILEGPLAGGHLGFSTEQLDHINEYSLEKLLPDVLSAVKSYEEKYGKKIPIIVGGGIFDGKDIKQMLSLGASGVQMGTRFVCTDECNVSPEFKQAYLEASEEDIEIIKSPVGMPGRAIKNKFLKRVENNGRLRIKCPYKCLSACDIVKAKYCIAKALLNSWAGDVDNGLIFCGQNAYRVNKIISVKELFSELCADLKAA